MNKRGNIPIFLLAVFGVVLVGVALFAMVTFDNGISNESNVIASGVSEFAFRQEFVPIVFERMVEESIDKEVGSFEENFEAAAERRRDPEFGNLFAKIIQGDYSYDSLKGVVRVEDVFFEVRSGGSEFRRDYEYIEIEFDLNGIVRKVYK